MSAAKRKMSARRKVVSWSKCLGPTNMISCRLECGHDALAYPRRGSPPNSCACRKCAAITNATGGKHG